MTPPVLARIRLVKEADEALIEAFHQRCSSDNLRRRWGRIHLTGRDLRRLLDHTQCWIALDADDQPLALACAGPISREPGVFDLGLQVADAHQHHGIGTTMARHAAEHARAQGAHTLSAYTEATNQPVLRLLARLGPIRHTRDGTHLDVRIPLGSAATTQRLPHPELELTD